MPEMKLGGCSSFLFLSSFLSCKNDITISFPPKKYDSPQRLWLLSLYSNIICRPCLLCQLQSNGVPFSLCASAYLTLLVSFRYFTASVLKECFNSNNLNILISKFYLNFYIFILVFLKQCTFSQKQNACLARTRSWAQSSALGKKELWQICMRDYSS